MEGVHFIPDVRRKVWLALVLQQRTDLPQLPLEMILLIAKHITLKVVRMDSREWLAAMEYETMPRIAPCLLTKKRYFAPALAGGEKVGRERQIFT
jgi:hypothetical protein